MCSLWLSHNTLGINFSTCEFINHSHHWVTSLIVSMTKEFKFSGGQRYHILKIAFLTNIVTIILTQHVTSKFSNILTSSNYFHLYVHTTLIVHFKYMKFHFKLLMHFSMSPHLSTHKTHGMDKIWFGNQETHYKVWFDFLSSSCKFFSFFLENLI